MDITLNDIGFAYRRRTALREVTWTIRPGVTGLLGPNGAGKTTLLSILIGSLSPKSGSVTFGNGGDRPRLGFVPQRFSLAGEMRVLDTVAYTAWVNGVPRRECDAAAKRAIELVGLTDKAHDRVRSLSGGQRQRLGFACGIAHDPSVLILDEPTVGLDPSQRLRVREVIAGIGDSRTVVLSTHLMEDIQHLCQRVGVLSDGKLVFDGTVAELSATMDTTSPSPPGGAFGSDFERGYDALLARLRGEA